MSRDEEDSGLPASHIVRILDMANRLGVADADLLAGLRLSRKDLVDPDLSVTVSTVTAVFERARTLSGEPALGIQAGLATSASSHGFLGFAAMSAGTLGEALALVVRYSPTRSTAFEMRLDIEGPSRAALVVDERVDFGRARDTVLLALLVGFWSVGNALLGEEKRDSVIELAFGEPEYFSRFKGALPRVRFGQTVNRLVFDAALLQTRLVSANAASLRLARDQCDRLLDSLESRPGLVDRARRLVLRSDGGIRTLEQLAAAVNVSPRTLRRRLAEHKLTYSAVLDEERRERAVRLLRSPDLSMKEIADRLGYSNVPNFLRAFRRWTGQTPAVFRAAQDVSAV